MERTDSETSSLKASFWGEFEGHPLKRAPCFLSITWRKSRTQRVSLELLSAMSCSLGRPTGRVLDSLNPGMCSSYSLTEGVPLGFNEKNHAL